MNKKTKRELNQYAMMACQAEKADILTSAQIEEIKLELKKKSE